MDNPVEIFSDTSPIKVIDSSSDLRAVKKEGGSSLVRYLLWASKRTWLALFMVFAIFSFYFGTFLSRHSLLPGFQLSSLRSAFLFAFWLGLFSLASGAFDRSIRTDFLRIYRKLFFSWAFAVVFTVTSFVFLTYETVGRFSIIYGAVVSLLVFTTILYFLGRKLNSNPYYVCLIGPTSPITSLIKDELSKRKNCLFLHVDFSKDDCNRQEVESILNDLHRIGVRDLVFSLAIDLKSNIPSYTQLGIFSIRRAFYLRNEINYYSRVFERFPLEHMSAHNLFIEDFATLNPFNSTVKRLFDISASFFALLVSLPIMGMLFCLIKMTSRGPAFFLQKRKGIGGTEFTLYKFRSMTWEESDVDQTFEKAKRGSEDLRVTWVGKWMRRLHLDEIPQFFNILKGDMSFVGPRPETTEISDKIIEFQPFFEMRTLLRPGLTGLAQLSQGKTLYGEEEITRKLSYDLYYIKAFSLTLDLWLIFRTAFLLTKKTW